MRHIAQFFTIEYHRPVMPPSALFTESPVFALWLVFVPLDLNGDGLSRDG